MHPMLNIAVRAARAAGSVITRNVDRVDTLKIDKKQRNDFVSEVDRNAEAAIFETLKKAYPDHTLLGEESGYIGDKDAEAVWIVDPLDGTLNFLHGFPHYCVSIALQMNGKLDQAVIYDPISQELFTASRGHGALLNNRRIRVGTVNALEDALLGTGMPYREGQELDNYSRQVHEFSLRSGGIRRPGSAALELAYVAAGRLDGFWQAYLKPWDCAAGALIVREAGGLIADFNGDSHWMDNGDIVAANPKIFHQMITVLKGI